MSRVQISLKDLKPNPFYRQVRGGKLNAGLVERLVESIEGMGFWENIVCRKVDNSYQIAHGHHRVEAAKRKLGSNAKVSIQVEDYSDSQMIRAMWGEDTIRKGESVEAQADIVRLAAKHLAENPEACRFRAPGARKAGGRPHEHGSVECVSAFLEDKKWGRTKVAELLRIGKPRVLSPKVMRRVDRIGAKAATQIARLKDHTAQETLVGIAEKHGFNHRDVQEVVTDVIDFGDPDEKQEDAMFDIAMRVSKDRDRRTTASARKKNATGQHSELHDPLTYIDGLIGLLRKVEHKYIMLTTISPDWWMESRQSNMYIVELRNLGEIIYKQHQKIFEPIKKLNIEEAPIEEGGKGGRREKACGLVKREEQVKLISGT